jgi:hypothetical protein
MTRYIVHAVLEDVHPRALVETGGEYYSVAHPEAALQASSRMSESHFRAALSKHGYEPLDAPLALGDDQALRDFLASRALDPAALLEGLS